MEEKKFYTEEEIEQLAEQASQNAMEHFKHGLNCGECVLQGFLDLGISEYPGSKQGRKNPYAKETFAERVDELHHDETGIYPRHAVYVKDVIKEYGTIECRDLCFPFDESTKEGMKERARNCKKIIGFCAKAATKAALKQ